MSCLLSFMNLLQLRIQCSFMFFFCLMFFYIKDSETTVCINSTNYCDHSYYKLNIHFTVVFFSIHPLIHQVKGHYFCRKEWNAEKRRLQMEIKELSKQIRGNEESLRKCIQDSKKVKWLSRNVLHSTEN